MVIVECQYCGKEFEAKQRNRKFCSDSCRNQNHYENQTFDQRLRYKINHCLADHRRNGFEVIGSTTEYIHTYDGHCALCGMEFDIFSSDKYHTGSLDRIDNDNIITPDTIQWLCYSCNATKSNRSNKEFYEYIMKILPKLEEVIQDA